MRLSVTFYVHCLSSCFWCKYVHLGLQANSTMADSFLFPVAAVYWTFSQRLQREHYKSLPIFECWIKGFVFCLLIPLQPRFLLNHDNRLRHIDIFIFYSDSKEFQHFDLYPDSALSFFLQGESTYCLSPCRKNIDLGIFTTRSLGEDSSPKGRKWQDDGENYVLRGFRLHNLYYLSDIMTKVKFHPRTDREGPEGE